MNAIRTPSQARSRPWVRAILAAFPLAVILALLPRSGRALDRPADYPPPPGGTPADSQAVRIVPLPPHTLDVRVWTDQTNYRINDDVRVFFSVNRDARVYIFNTDASGQHRQLLPNAHDRDNWIQGGVTYSIPDAGYRLVATGPVGWESLHIVAYASRTIYFPQYGQFPDPDNDAFPARPEGAELLLERLRADQQSGDTDSNPVPDQRQPSATQPQTSASKAPAPLGSTGSQTFSPQSIVVRPPIRIPPPDYGDAKVFFYVGTDIPEQPYPYPPYPSDSYYYDYGYTPPYGAYPCVPYYFYYYDHDFPRFYHRRFDRDDSFRFHRRFDGDNFRHDGNRDSGDSGHSGQRPGGGGFQRPPMQDGSAGQQGGGFQRGFRGGDGRSGGSGGPAGGGMRGGSGGGGRR